MKIEFLLLALAACGPSTFSSEERHTGIPLAPADAASDALEVGDAVVLDAPVEAAPDSGAPNVCYTVGLDGETAKVVCSGSNPFTWLATLDGGQKTQVSCAEQKCPYAAKCYVQGLPGNGVCAP